jgi:hypothetical protein
MFVLAILIGLLGAGPIVNDISGGGPPGYVAGTSGATDYNGSGPPGRAALTDGSDALSGNGPPG